MMYESYLASGSFKPSQHRNYRHKTAYEVLHLPLGRLVVARVPHPNGFMRFIRIGAKWVK